MTLNVQAVIVAQNAATATATLLAGETFASETEMLETFARIQTSIFNTSFLLAGVESVVEMLDATPAPAAPRSSAPRNSGGGAGGNNADPGSLAFNSGKKRGQTISDVYADDPSYIEWCARELKNDFMRGKCELFLSQQAA